MQLYELIPALSDDPLRIGGGYDFRGFDICRFWREGNDAGNDVNQMHAKIEGTEPVDLLAGPLSLPIVSGRFRDHLQDFRLPEIEFKPITFAPDYYLLNFFTSYDCIDLENSPGWTRDEDGLTPAGTTMAVSASKIPSNADIFRMDGVSDCILFREPVAMSLKGKGFKGVAFIRRACIGIELCRNEE